MTSPEELQLRQQSEEADRKFMRAILTDLSLELSRAQHELLGFSVKITPGYILLSIRTYKEGERWVSFVGAEGIRSLFIKAASMARTRKLTFKVDTFAK